MLNVKFIWNVNTDKPWNVKYHVHNYYEIIYYFSGSGHVDYYVGSKEYEGNHARPTISYIDESIENYSVDQMKFSSNQLMVISPKTAHNSIHDTACKEIDIGFELHNSKLSLPNSVIDDSKGEIAKLINRIVGEHASSRPFYQEYIVSLVEELVVMLNRKIKNESTLDDPIIIAQNYINKSFAEDIDLENIYVESGYSPEHFRFLFKERTGLSPKSYIISKRINYACTLLTETDYSISKVANMSGYDDVSQFIVIFKKRMGVSPSKFKEKAKE